MPPFLGCLPRSQREAHRRHLPPLLPGIFLANPLLRRLLLGLESSVNAISAVADLRGMPFFHGHQNEGFPAPFPSTNQKMGGTNSNKRRSFVRRVQLDFGLWAGWQFICGFRPGKPKKRQIARLQLWPHCLRLGALAQGGLTRVGSPKWWGKRETL